MSHWRKLFDERFLGSWDFEDEAEQAFTIKAVDHETLHCQSGDDEVKPVLWFEATPKGMVLNKTNADRIARLHGDDYEQWLGKAITLTTERVKAFGAVHDAIRVKTGPERREPKREERAPLPTQTDPRVDCGDDDELKAALHEAGVTTQKQALAVWQHLVTAGKLTESQRLADLALDDTADIIARPSELAAAVFGDGGTQKQELF